MEGPVSPARGAQWSESLKAAPEGQQAEGELVDFNLQKEPKETLVEYLPPEYVEDAQSGAKFVPPKKAGLREVLDAILPERRWNTAEGHAVHQVVSAKKAERDDVVALQMRLDEKLRERQAMETGLCPVREELYSQCFDELIRQIAIERPERGLLLLRVRDEVRMTIAAYNTLYDSSITFGLRKTLQAERGNVDVKKKLEDLRARKSQLQAALQQQKSHLEQTEREISERRSLQERKLQEEKEFLKLQAQHLDSFLKGVEQQQASGQGTDQA